MKKLIICLLLIIAGASVILIGQRRADSIAGISDSLGAKIANKWDGKVRQPGHVWYYAGGGALILAGLAVALQKNTGA